MPKILKEYLSYLRANNYSEKTIETYCYDMMTFFKFIKEYMYNQIPIEEFNIFILMQVKEWDIDVFLVYLNHEKNNGSSTRDKRITVIRMFYKWLMNKYPKQILDNPVKQIYIQKTIRLPKHLQLEDAKKLIGIFNKNNSYNYKRDNLIIEILLTTGIRRGELVNINIKDIDLDNKKIKIRGKGNKERFVYVPERTRMQIKEFIRKKDKSIPLICSKQNKRLSCNSVYNIVKKAINLAGLNGYSTHSLRHTFASIIYEEKEDILLVKELLGHTSLASTQIYTHLSSKKMKSIMEKNPLNIVGGI